MQMHRDKIIALFVNHIYISFRFKKNYTYLRNHFSLLIGGLGGFFSRKK